MSPVEPLLRQIPSVDKLLKNEIIAGARYRHEMLDAARSALDQLRGKITTGELDKVPSEDEIANNVLKMAECHAQKGVRNVINGTGVVLHSNLGRACLSKAAARAAEDAAARYCTLEYDTEEGARGSRTGFIEERLRAITGCESALIVNNNAAAMLLILNVIAKGGNVIVSRGELVEIGGGFRIPDILEQCGCLLREVGTTNKTRLSDYSAAVDENTKALLKVHTSNFKITGFTESVTIHELSELGNERNIPVVEDIGSGALIDLRRFGIYGEPYVAESLESGADIVTFSGDKLLGGPQCGIVLGREQYISDMKRHPLYRALRVDKMTIAALEATLRAYPDPIAAAREIPVISMLSLTKDALYNRAQELAEEISRRGGYVEIIQVNSAAGGGAAPELKLDSYAISPVGDKSAAETDYILRTMPTPVIGRIEKDRFLLDVRTLFEEDYSYIADAITGVTK